MIALLVQCGTRGWESVAVRRQPWSEPLFPTVQRPAILLTVTNFRKWPGRAKAEFKLAAVNQSSKAAQWGKF